MDEHPRVLPLAEALAALDTPDAVADRRRRAEKWYAELAADSGPGLRSIALDPLAAILFQAGTLVD